MDRPRDCHTKSEKDKYHMISHLKKMIQIYLFAKQIDSDIENKLMVTKGDGTKG